MTWYRYRLSPACKNFDAAKCVPIRLVARKGRLATDDVYLFGFEAVASRQLSHMCLRTQVRCSVEVARVTAHRRGLNIASHQGNQQRVFAKKSTRSSKPSAKLCKNF